ncbi:hypothetical protein HPB49_023848 [Dermacentor silvarum]|uniref:Uncharacterized protein n=1 Tax=Dermacentor silvarum TaxID=543639 RepID=A0ACB8E4Y9_DERSI|nr:hypothetical protein HPB49_023848 [Dermacentor silvarum]
MKTWQAKTSIRPRYRARTRLEVAMAAADVEGSSSSSSEEDCFKGNWDSHKQVHRVVKNAKAAASAVYNPWPSFSFTGKLRPFPLSQKREVPEHIMRPDYADHPEGIPLSEQAAKHSSVIKILDEEETEGVRLASKAKVLDVALGAAEVGVTTDELDRLVHEASVERDCYPSPLNYYKFPKSCCT